jgi:hypothetical protein
MRPIGWRPGQSSAAEAQPPASGGGFADVGRTHPARRAGDRRAGRRDGVALAASDHAGGRGLGRGATDRRVLPRALGYRTDSPGDENARLRHRGGADPGRCAAEESCLRHLDRGDPDPADAARPRRSGAPSPAAGPRPPRVVEPQRGVFDAGPDPDVPGYFIRVRHARHLLAAHERRDLDAAQAGVRQRIDQFDFPRGRYGAFLDLEALARAFLGNQYGGGRRGIILS